MPGIRKLLKLGIRDSRYRMLGLLCENGRIRSDKEHAHELIDQLPPSQLSAVVSLLEARLDPAARAIASAPFDDEPVTAEEGKALAESREWLQHNKPIPHEQVLTELGITQEEIDHFLEPK
jgi:hypothetical protein